MNPYLSYAVEFNLSRVRQSLTEYAALAQKTEGEAIAKQLNEIAWNVYYGLRQIMPAKNAVRDLQLARLRSGSGVRVRPAVLKAVAEKYNLQPGGSMVRKRGGKIAKELKALGFESVVSSRSVLVDGKRLNFRALAVKRELAVRESARGFLAYSTPRMRKNEQPPDVIIEDVNSRYGFRLSQFTANIGDNLSIKQGEVKWYASKEGDYQQATEGLNKMRQMTIIAEAVGKAYDNMQVYIQRKLGELARRLKLNP
jgi:hypothetical protein